MFMSLRESARGGGVRERETEDQSGILLTAESLRRGLNSETV